VEIRQLLREYNRQYGTTVIVSSHLLSEIEIICDDLVMIAGGRLRAAGSLADLLSIGGKVRLLCNSQVQASEFLRKKYESGESWICSEPDLRDDGVYFHIPNDEALPQASGELFRAGFAISHFGRERQNLEEFFINQTTGEAL